MCGIAGIFDLRGERDVNRDALNAMNDRLIHRGPDGEGYYYAPGIGLAHRRLAIIDRIGGAQPFHAQKDGSVLSFNGEIYNYPDLARKITNIDLRTRSDTEVLAEGLAAQGTAFLHELRGMFAISFWNPIDKSLLLARDRIGERPLYYAVTNDGFLVFASEIGAIVASGLVETGHDPRAIADYFFYGYVPDPKTIYRGIYKLPPGHILALKKGSKPNPERYWRPVFTNGAALTIDDAAEQLRDKVDEAVRYQLVSDVPLGAFLSGGVDSASIVSAMAQTDTAIKACTIGFDSDSHDERAAAREIATKYNATHFEGMAKCEATALIDVIAKTYGEPFADASALPSYLVSQIARQHVTVALSGDGGDEIFAGYRRYPFHLAEEKLRRFAPLSLRKMIFGTAGALYPKLDWAPRPLRFKTTFQSLGMSSSAGYAAAVAINLPDRIGRMLNPDFYRSLAGYEPQSVISDAMDKAGTNDPLARAQYADMMTWLPGRMLTKVDRASMAHSLEVRPPLLDHKIIEWAGSLPANYKLDGHYGKRILKSAFTPRLGREFIARKKQGFAPPITEWLRRDNDNPALRLNASRYWRDSGIFNEKQIDRMIDDHRRSSVDCAQELWSVVMFDAFLRTSRI
ncbi:asparagine synthase (glutamine-hydrolyzing) [Hyphococcus formosus]|uniref:asparagine synthase (glutamine-hydrolyzing) n=1 Tax=Hyphococcus formosus TaxID=3143534 RepID=UPI00398A5685